MPNKRVARVLLVGCVMVSILVSLAPPGVSKEEHSKVCPKFKPAEPKSMSEETGEALDAKVLAVTDVATEDDPLVLELDFGLAVWLLDPRGDPNDPDSIIPVIEDTQFFNFQVNTDRREVALSAELAWEDPWQAKDLDEFLYDTRGRRVAYSMLGLNCCPLVKPVELASIRARNCDGFTLEARAFRSLPDTAATLSIWLRGRGD